MCSNDLDHIYALLSLLGSADVVVEPDYNISAEQLFIQTTKTMMQDMSLGRVVG